MMAPYPLTMTMPCTFLWVCMRFRVYSTYDIVPVILLSKRERRMWAGGEGGYLFKSSKEGKGKGYEMIGVIWVW
jgi:hypothetical protein